MNEKTRVHVFVKGLVQGVFFRQNTQQMAEVLGLTGWVRNTADGKVEAVFEGEKEKAEEMLQWIEKGPTLARVDGIEFKWEEYKGEFKDFKIR